MIHAASNDHQHTALKDQGFQVATLVLLLSFFLNSWLWGALLTIGEGQQQETKRQRIIRDIICWMFFADSKDGQGSIVDINQIGLVIHKTVIEQRHHDDTQQRNESQSPLTPNQNTHQHHGSQRIDTHQGIAHKSDYHDESSPQP